LALLVLAMVMPVAAGAETFTVDSIGDQPDLAADGGCSTVAGKCTLRAAIEEANTAVTGGDEIGFDGGVFDGEADSTIALGSNLPDVVKPVAIDGGRCETEADAEGPCVAIDGTNSGPGLKIEADGVAVEGIDFFDAATGIELVAADEFRVSGNWFGVELDGGLLDAGNGTAVLVGPDSDNGVIGGKEAGAGNLFVHGVNGLELLGASENEILGNRFGFAPDGTAVDWGEFNRAITVVSAPLAGSEAVGNVIGTRPDPTAAATSACDGGCNLIAEAGYALVLDWEGEQRGPAVETTVRGNQFGIDPSGTKAVGNGDAIDAGLAPDTVVGGFGAGDGNRINGGGSAIRGGGPDLVIAGNSIGLNADGSKILAPPIDGIRVFAEELQDPSEEAIVVGNEIGLDGGCGIEQDGLGATLVGNEIFGAEIGIVTSQANNEHGSLIEANLIEGSGTVGVMVENDFNEIFGNEIFESGLDGIAIFGRNNLDATRNLIGGDTLESENTISFNGRYAILIAGVEGSQNEVARNRGLLNEESFIHLFVDATGFEPIGPNGGIEPPEISDAAPTGATGTAEPGATVRVFRKESDEPGEIESFLGEAVADSGGEWAVDYGSALPGGTPVAATQTNVEGGTSELEFATTPVSPVNPAGVGSRNPQGSPQPDANQPQTFVTKGPKKTRRKVVRFSFRSTGPGSGFQCRVDRQLFHSCSSPVRYRGLKPGRHRFEVRAVDPTGNVDSTPVKRVFIVLAP
jgi:CSLREA domain-containing protein